MRARLLSEPDDDLDDDEPDADDDDWDDEDDDPDFNSSDDDDWGDAALDQRVGLTDRGRMLHDLLELTGDGE